MNNPGAMRCFAGESFARTRPGFSVRGIEEIARRLPNMSPSLKTKDAGRYALTILFGSVELVSL